MRIDSTTLDVYRRLGRTSDGQILRKHLSAELESVKSLLVTAPVEQVPKLQGKAAALADVLEAFTS